jgi:hypothetical protein
MSWSLFGDLEIIKLAAAVLGLSAAAFTVVDKIVLSLKKPQPPPPALPASNTYNFFLMAPLAFRNLVLQKK